MKKLLYISGSFSALLLVLLLTGWAYADDAVKAAMQNGNTLFESSEYANALAEYEKGLLANSKSKALNYNAAQAAYLVGEYEKALEFFEKSANTVEKFLAIGNMCYRAGEAVEDANQKAELYAQALQVYQEGIIKFPKDISLKYNYETVKEKLEQLLEESGQEDSEQSEDGEEQNGEQGEEQDASSGESSEDSEDSESSQGSQEEDTEQSEESKDSQNQAQEGDEEQDGYSQGEEENATDQEAVERILQMLENQEEESLKNNQEIIGGNEDKNGW